MLDHVPNTPRRAALRAATQVRLDETLHRYVLITAARHDISVSAALRVLLDQALDAEPPVRMEDGGDAAIPFRAVVEMVDVDAIEELADKLPSTADEHAPA